jgi:hypothetical protein
LRAINKAIAFNPASSWKGDNPQKILYPSFIFIWVVVMAEINLLVALVKLENNDNASEYKPLYL